MRSRPIVSRSRDFAAAPLAAVVLASLAACGGGSRADRTATTGETTAASRVAVAPVASARVDPTTDTAPSTRMYVPTLADTVDPAITLRAYLDRALLHRATHDSALWEPSSDGASGFRAFADTTISSFRIGAPGPIEGAAGSRYVTLPVSVDVTSGMTRATLHATATLRRAVVDGATDAQRRWRIVRIEWSEAR